MVEHELSKLTREKPAEAKRRIRDAYRAAGYSYDKAAASVGMHVSTFRSLAQRLKLTRDLRVARQEGLGRDGSGRPRIAAPAPSEIQRALDINKGSVEEAANAFGVSAPTFRQWMRAAVAGDGLRKENLRKVKTKA